MIKVTTSYKEDMLFESKAGNHRLQTDAPALLGGKNRAPQPYNLFMAAVGSSIGQAVVDHCRRYGFDMRDMSVDVEMDEVENPSRIANLRVTIHIPHSDCRGQEKAILRLAEHCPIYETMIRLNGIQQLHFTML